MPKIRQMTQIDYEKVIHQWMITEKWNPGKYDQALYFAGDAKNLKYYVLEHEDKVIASIMIYQYDATFSVLGAYIVATEDRGKGFGKTLFDYAISMIEKECKTIRLYAVPTQISNYEKSGFFGKGNTHRWQKSLENPIPCSNKDIMRATKPLSNELVEYDTKHFGTVRKSILETLTSLPFAALIFSNDHKTGKINGIAAIRKCEEGYRIGPVYANTPETAKELFLSLFSTITSKEQTVFFDSNIENTHVYNLAEYLKFEHKDATNCTEMHRITSIKEDKPMHTTTENSSTAPPEEYYAGLSLEIGL